MPDCIFCKIVEGEIPNYTVYEDENVLAFLDIHAHAKGHTIVILKKHGEVLFDYTEEEIKELSLGVKRAMDKIEKVLYPDGYNVGWNQKEVAGQVIPHHHIHIMPRYDGDGGGNMHSVVNNNGGMNVEKVAKLF